MAQIKQDTLSNGLSLTGGILGLSLMAAGCAEFRPEMVHNEVLLYVDRGVAERSRAETNNSFDPFLHQAGFHSRVVTSSDMHDPQALNLASTIIMPGGADLPYCAALNGEPNLMIHKFVEDGGSYIGFCAGAYYASSYVEFDRGGALEVSGKRELSFFPGVSRGPAYGTGTFHYDTDEGARLVPIIWCGSEEKAPDPLFVYYNGGGIFVDAESYAEVKVLARYGDISGHPAAIIECQVGKGRAILSAVHPEYDLSSTAPKSSHSTEIMEELKRHEEGRRWLLGELIKRGVVDRKR